MDEFNFQILRDLAADDLREALGIVKNETLSYKVYALRITPLEQQSKDYPFFIKLKIDFSYSGDNKPNGSIFVEISSVNSLESCVNEKILWLNLLNKRVQFKK